jgi:Mn2+/Fe2+ NRAMP family transporter
MTSHDVASIICLVLVLGSSSRTAFAIAMLCAGQSSSLDGVLSTQYIMEGFFELKMGPATYRSPRHPTCFKPSSLELNGIL